MRTWRILGVLLEVVSKVNRNLKAFVRKSSLLNEHLLLAGVTWDGVYCVIFWGTFCHHNL